MGGRKGKWKAGIFEIAATQVGYKFSKHVRTPPRRGNGTADGVNEPSCPHAMYIAQSSTL